MEKCDPQGGGWFLFMSHHNTQQIEIWVFHGISMIFIGLLLLYISEFHSLSSGKSSGQNGSKLMANTEALLWNNFSKAAPVGAPKLWAFPGSTSSMAFTFAGGSRNSAEYPAMASPGWSKPQGSKAYYNPTGININTVDFIPPVVQYAYGVRYIGERGYSQNVKPKKN